ncbi:MAG TPA: CinA family nicotinamide mononucleotide deamidase-related protein [Myxococcaceae bacterium]|nr:CinA family nicotinamide mononucleotide deamidase-related protein [Myxococcaceae bacterium]
MRIEVLCTGDELLTGITGDTNSPFFLERLFRIGEKLAWSQTVGDVREDIERALKEISASADAVLVSGGLGPTADDLTMECAARVAGVRLVEDPRVLESIRARFASRNLVFSANNARQALVPEGAEAVLNPVGSAPMVIQKLGRCTVFYVPGVPREYKHLVEQEVLPRLEQLIRAQPARVFRASRMLKTVGLPESHLDAMVAPLAKVHSRVIFGFRTHAPENHLKLMAEGESQAEADRSLADVERDCREVLGAFVFGAEGDDFPGTVVRLLAARKETLAFAESCTGGLAAAMVTSVPGASDVLLGSAVTYAESLKVRWAQVPEQLLSQHGAVSAPVAEAMAAGIRRETGASWGLGITGYAGPSGGTEQDPVGTVYLGLASDKDAVSRRCLFSGDRERVRQFAAYTALDMLRRRVLGVEPA